MRSPPHTGGAAARWEESCERGMRGEEEAKRQRRGETRKALKANGCRHPIARTGAHKHTEEEENRTLEETQTPTHAHRITRKEHQKRLYTPRTDAR